MDLLLVFLRGHRGSGFALRSALVLDDGLRAPRLPCAPCDAGLPEQGSEPRAIAGRNQRPGTSERVTVAIDLGEQRVAIGERDVAPHLRRSGGDTREIAKAARRMVEIRG